MKIIQVINVQEPAARKNRFLDIEHVVQRQSSALCTCLPGLNASTGCYSEGAFFGKGKLVDEATREVQGAILSTWH